MADSSQTLFAEEPSSSLAELVDGYTWAAITADAPEWYVCPIYKTLFGEAEAFDEACTTTPLSFAPSLLEILTSSSPPSLDFFRGLPALPADEKVWAVYVLLLEKPGCPAKIYIGSGTDEKAGAKPRLRNYENGTHLPRFVERALDDGYAYTNRGLLCWAPLPAGHESGTARARFVAVEAVFAFIFFAGFETKLDGLWTVFLPWKREDVGWLPMCSHTALNERPKGVTNMTEAQWEEYDAERKKKIKAQMAIHSARAEDRQRQNDLEGYLTRKRREKLAWSHKNKDRVHEIAAGVRARAIKSGKHACQTCGINLQSITALRKHMASKAHKEQERLAAGGSAKAVSAVAEHARRFAAEKRASKAYYCATCDMAFNIKGHLTKHCNSKKHLNKVAASS